ncbi:MAG: PhnD/SsuA/transferrin family substrate-binding protein [Sulfitobacter sp.]|nr:PhnD/SsuA/transferrin family substrate-binding protein [Sulfitobacter sp.]
MIASLMMYARPELDAAQGRYWELIRAELAERGIAAPTHLANTVDPIAVWTSPDLVLSQTCGMPYRRFLHGKVVLVGTPDFGVEGCPPGYYHSVIVVHREDARERLVDYADARFAYNETGSQSGYAAPHALARAMGFWFKDRLQTHGHLNSARAVAEGRADIAALDAVSWRLMQRYDGFAQDLRVLTVTKPTPGLPYITGLTDQAGAVFAAVSAAIGKLDNKDLAALGLRGIVRIPATDYLAIPNPPPEDC